MRRVGVQWRKSSFSEDSDGNCIEVGLSGDGVLIRESDEPGTVVTTASDGLRVFLADIKAGAADRLV
ncbi:DUF397 domain-containing protein [Streptomyces phaeolivaceus]|uniref:DUF397 domain-containing protein n=1 Tax=Streptomyces phaeolivaceus TaxID=2653200 RepID=A0A5P8KI45_9ACTN|nr:DUF397 domain-containing protein [Streptomyces phaeolivaceus]